MTCQFAAALALRGTGALLNFPKLAHSLPRPADLTDKSVQAAATIAANNFAAHPIPTPEYNLQQMASSLASTPEAPSPNPTAKPSPGSSSHKSTRPSSTTPHKTTGASSAASGSTGRGKSIYQRSNELAGESPAYYPHTSATPAVDSSSVPNVSCMQQPPPSMFVDSEDMFTMGGPAGLTTALCDAMCIPPPQAEHAAETDGEEGSTPWEPHLWSY